MPADPSLSSQPSQHHGSGDAPYPCHTWVKPPGAAWAIDYGYCRTSLDWHGDDSPKGAGDPRCPSDCPHKAPRAVAIRFCKAFSWRGAAAAAAGSREHRSKNNVKE